MNLAYRGSSLRKGAGSRCCSPSSLEALWLHFPVLAGFSMLLMVLAFQVDPAAAFMPSFTPVSPVRLSTAEVREHFQCVSSVDELNAWVVGNVQALPGRGSDGRVLCTHDGGTTWQRWILTKHSLFAVSAPTARTAFVVGERGLVFVTHDGGVSWKSRSLPTRGDLCAVSAPNEQVSWVAGAFGFVALTKDGGETWQTVHTDLNHRLISICALSGRVAWIGRLDGVAGRTTDAGAHWTVSRVPHKDRFVEMYCLTAASARVAWQVGRNGRVFKTTDGGVTWIRLRSGVTDWLWSASAVDEQVVWAVGKLVGITALHTVNGGETWDKLRPGNGRLLSISAVSEELAWAAGDFGLVRRTTDSGATWSNVSPPPP